MKKIEIGVICILTLIATGQIKAKANVIVDDFNNGVVTNSDSTTGFWQVLGNAAEVSSELTLRSEYRNLAGRHADR